MKRLVVFFIISMLTVLSVSYAAEIIVPTDIRVGIYYNSTAKDSVTLSSPGGIEVGINSNGKFVSAYKIGPNEKIVVKKNYNSKYGVYVGNNKDSIGTINEYPYFKSIEKDGVSIISVDGQNYRGNIEIRRIVDSENDIKSDMTVINHVSMQEYLYGVVPREIGGNSSIEAVKAQAIVARTYAAKNYGKNSKLGFDLKPTVEDQAYGGYEWENKNSNKAVDETDGQVVVYDGKLINGNYFSTSGGTTESSENVWGGVVDYLKAVPDTYEPNVEGNTTWEVTKTASEIKDALSKKGINVGDIVDLVPTKLSDAGRILELKVVGTNGEEVITKDRARTYLGLKSQWYTVNAPAPQIVLGVEKESEDNVSDNVQVTKVSSELEDDNTEATEDDNTWWLNSEPIKISQQVDYNIDVSKITKELNDEFISNDEKIEIAEDKESENIIVADNKPNSIDSLLSRIVQVLNSFTKQKTVIKAEPIQYAAETNKTTFTFRGRGWGHAVGMSQNGAKGMAENGFSAEEIIKWYYTGVQIVK